MLEILTQNDNLNEFQGTFACSCDFGYAGDGYHCIDHDECEAGDHLCPGLSFGQKSNLQAQSSGLSDVTTVRPTGRVTCYIRSSIQLIPKLAHRAGTMTEVIFVNAQQQHVVTMELAKIYQF